MNLIEQVLNGRDVRVRRRGENSRVVSVAQMGVWKDYDFATVDYEALMQATIAELAARDGRDLAVEVKTDYYGAQWLEVRSGLMGRRVSRLSISPRHMQLLQIALAQRTKSPTE